jgi:hypothetical protein
MTTRTDSERLARIETLLDQLVGNGQPGRCSVHSQRIRKLEVWKGWITGALALLSLMTAAAVTIVAAMAGKR